MDIKLEVSKFASNHGIDDLVAIRLGWYVYGIYEPGESLPFYIGKGKGSRVLQHFEEAVRSAKASEKLDAIRLVLARGSEPVIRIMRSKIDTEQHAYEVESALIDAIRPLGNKVLGHDSDEHGVIDLRNLVAEYGATELEKSEILHRLLLIKIDQRWSQENLSHNLDSKKLYECVFGYWRVDPTRAEGCLVAAVAGGIIREIYSVDAWYRAGRAHSADPTIRKPQDLSRWEFDGRQARENIRRLYIGRSVKTWFAIGAQTPIRYLPDPAL